MSRLRQRLWDAERFGLSPAKMAQRLLVRNVPKLICISVPKAGTHLLERAVCKLPGMHRKLLPTLHDSNIERYGGLEAVLGAVRGGEIVVGHLSYSEHRDRAVETYGLRSLFMVRDPRDLVVSQAEYILRRRDHERHELFSQCADLRARIELAIRGDRESAFPSLAERLEQFAGWLDSGAMLVRFEDLIGPRGGGDRLTQIRLLGALCEYLSIGTGTPQSERLAEQIFSSLSPTFAKGRAGRWREVFDSDLLRLFEREAGEQAVRYGYPGG